MAYGAGRYRGDYGGGGYRGDSIFSKIGKVVKGVAGVAGAFVGGIARSSGIGQVIGGIAPVIQQFAGGGGGAPQAPAPMRAMSGGGPGTAVTVQGRVSPLGTVGMCPTDIVYTRSGQARKYRLKKDGGCTWHKRPTMNVMNPRAAAKAITRIKGARHLLHAIESSLPKSKAKAPARGKCGCK